MRNSLRLVYLSVLLLSSCSWSQAQKQEETSVVGRRPVRDVILQWERQYGWVITYEDPRFEYADDLEDVTLRVRKDLKAGEPIDPAKRIVGARERQLSVSYETPESASDASARLEATNQLVKAFGEATGNTLIVSQSGTRVHILPGLIRDASGQSQPSKPILDTIISVPAQDRNGGEFLDAMCHALTDASGHRIFLGTIPSNAMAQFHTKAGYQNIPAQHVLEDFLDRMPHGERYTWALLFLKDYALNIHWVRDPSQPEAPKTARTNGTPVTRRKVVLGPAQPQ